MALRMERRPAQPATDGFILVAGDLLGRVKTASAHDEEQGPGHMARWGVQAIRGGAEGGPKKRRQPRHTQRWRLSLWPLLTVCRVPLWGQGELSGDVLRAMIY